jgi:hypothetical protein
MQLPSVDMFDKLHNDFQGFGKQEQIFPSLPPKAHDKQLLSSS